MISKLKTSSYYSVIYNKDSVQGKTEITCHYGSIMCVQNDGTLTRIDGGNSAIIQENVTKTGVLNVASSNGITTITHEPIAGAVNYMYEWISPSPTFTTPNDTVVEDTNRSWKTHSNKLRLFANKLTSGHKMSVVHPFIDVSNAIGMNIDLRVYPLDAYYNLIPGCTSSDTFSYQI